MRLRDEEGLGLVELLIAMLMLNIGILAIVASFNSGAVALRRASHASTASALADQQMEGYRALLYSQIGLDTGQIAGLDNTYRCDSALGASCPNTITSCSTGTCADNSVPTLACGSANTCLAARTVTGQPPRMRTSGRQLKQITIVVRDAATPTKTFTRLTSTVDRTVSSSNAAYRAGLLRSADGTRPL